MAAGMVEEAYMAVGIGNMLAAVGIGEACRAAGMV
jgi:hypothetical protein